MTPTPITKRLRRAQGESTATLTLLHHVGRVELYARQRQGHPRDYAVVRVRLVGHGATPSEALAAVRTQLHARRAARTEPLTWRDGLEAGFHSPCLYAFCQVYHLDPQGQVTLAELRRLVSQPGTPHRQAYIRGLRRFGLHLK